MIAPAKPQTNRKTIGRICHTNFEVPACWNAHSGYLLASIAVMIDTARTAIPKAKNPKKKNGMRTITTGVSHAPGIVARANGSLASRR